MIRREQDDYQDDPVWITYHDTLICDGCHEKVILTDDDINDNLEFILDDGWQAIEEIDVHYCKCCVQLHKEWEREHNGGKLVSDKGILA